MQFRVLDLHLPVFGFESIWVEFDESAKLDCKCLLPLNSNEVPTRIHLAPYCSHFDCQQLLS